MIILHLSSLCPIHFVWISHLLQNIVSTNTTRQPDASISLSGKGVIRYQYDIQFREIGFEWTDRALIQLSYEQLQVVDECFEQQCIFCVLLRTIISLIAQHSTQDNKYYSVWMQSHWSEEGGVFQWTSCAGQAYLLKQGVFFQLSWQLW